MLHFFLFIALILFLAYAVLILYYKAGWQQLDEYTLQRDYEPSTTVSIIIPARNEEKNLEHLMHDLDVLFYPGDLLEVIVVDDHSTDRTVDIVRRFPKVRLLSLQDFLEGETLNAYKKKAIETGIAQSKGELIITTDADVRLCNFWLLSIVAYYEQYRPQLIAAPVLLSNDGSVLQTFQSIDFMTMQGITAALSATRSGTMCNGANLAYTRQAYDAVNGFSGIDRLASGDDMLLMYKIERQYPGQTTYLKCKDAIVYTAPAPGWKAFLRQRIRWASKASHFDDQRINAILALVYIFNFLFPLVFVLSLMSITAFATFLFLWLGKTLVELAFIRPVSVFFYKRNELKWFALLQFLHIPYILYAGFMGQMGGYEWKGRKVR